MIKEQHEDTFVGTKSMISQGYEDDEQNQTSEIVVPMREPITGQAAEQNGNKVDGKLHG